MNTDVVVNKAVGFFGGTFDPVHFGHLRAAIECVKAFCLSEVRLLPCLPVHKHKTGASAQDRKQMITLAIKDTPQLALDDYELGQVDPTYTINTLQHFRSQLPNDTAIYFIVGADAFNGIETWKSWQSIFDLCNVIVVSRPSSHQQNCSDAIQQRIKLFNGQHVIAGNIYFLPISAIDISSTKIRDLLTAKEAVDFLLPHAVISYIQQQGLYQ